MTISLAGTCTLGVQSGTPLDASDRPRSSSPVPASRPQPGHMDSAAALLFLTDQGRWWDMLYNIMSVQSFSTNSKVWRWRGRSYFFFLPSHFLSFLLFCLLPHAGCNLSPLPVCSPSTSCILYLCLFSFNPRNGSVTDPHCNFLNQSPLS